MVAVVAFDGVVLSDLATPCDVFGQVRDSKGKRRYDVRVCGGRKVISEHLRIAAPWPFATLQSADTIIVPGIDSIDRSVPEGLIRALRRAVAGGERVASICTGAFVLARTGVLKGLKATTH
jgi:transcriptional regulator GlxA family with amidase domain